MDNAQHSFIDCLRLLITTGQFPSYKLHCIKQTPTKITNPLGISDPRRPNSI